MRTRVKICGITTPEDALAAVAAGADAIGLVFYERSPRYVSPEQAGRIVDVIPAFVSVVGLFVDAPLQVIDRLVQQVPLDLLQFHGMETVAQCEAPGRPYIKAVKVVDSDSVRQGCRTYTTARAILLDVDSRVGHGGTGQSFDWSLVPQELSPSAAARRSERLILAGGLNPDNVAQAIRQVGPYAVDVSSGVEASPGVKDERKMNQFIERVMHATPA